MNLNTYYVSPKIRKVYNDQSEILRFHRRKYCYYRKTKSAKYVIDTEKEGFPCAVFYGDEAHPVSNSRYFILYTTASSAFGSKLWIADGSFIEDQEIVGVIADDSEVIFSRYRHDYRTSTDGSVFIDGGRAYTRSNTDNFVTIKIKYGEVWVTRDI